MQLDASMGPARRDLAATERHLQAAVMARPEAGAPFDDARIEVYREMYRLRIGQALASDFPAVARFLGAARFAELCADYVEAHPSRSFTLEAIDGAMIGFLASWTGLQPSERDTTLELAALDRAAKALLAVDEATPLQARDLDEIDADAWEHAILEGVPALRVIRLAQGRRPCDVVVWRRGVALRRRTLSLPAGRFLRDLLDGLPLGAAVARAEVPEHRAAAHVSRWLRQWVAAGFFARVVAA